MASPSGSGSTAAPAPSASTGHAIIPAPIATNDQHVCFICLQNEVDTPNATWVNPCPCSLEAHADCMLRWIGEMEVSAGRAKNDLKCPACKAPIVVEEPFDPFLALHDRLLRRYSRVSPYVLLVLGFSGSIVGAAWYGHGAACIFAGRDAVSRWLRPQARQRISSFLLKVYILSTIGPGLVVMRWLSGRGSTLFLPCAVMYGASLVAHDDLPTWPPSPQWAFAMMPYVQLTYSYVMYELFGPLERRLNRALRGQPATEDDAAPREEQAPAIAAPEPAEGAVAVRDEPAAEGVWGTVANLGRTVLGVLLGAGGPVGVEVEIVEEVHFEEVGGEGNDQPGEDVGQALEQGVVEVEGDEFHFLAADAAAEPAQEQEQEQEQEPQQQPQQQQPAAAEQPAPQPVQQNQQPPPNENQRRNNNNNNNGDLSGLALLINSISTSLLFPVISYGMGELIRAIAPKAWVTRPWRKPPTGLLQERWGRSLVGGCLFVVLRDVIGLYTKYRRVQVKARRRIKNVERKTGRAVEGSAG
ncbi:uncharacterized protein B0T15DRAFT_141134 [Chaetomium strumarium]|uniref:RING-type domain-containing protein n=1 Tax=Chaetomium strumarium TaxID=1170767 RepID=A0AAJ0GUS2_9PEZI|nr:hypothetical protein B0T15DRAFT_141134 [Chaetomium strumarium]